MSAIGKGDWVECIDGSPHEELAVTLREGGVYRVRETCEGLGVHGQPISGVRLFEITLASGPRGIEAAWGIVRFRPIYRPKAEFITSLLAPSPAKPVRVGEDA